MKYIFRGNVVFDYREDTGRLFTHVVDDVAVLNHCKFIDQDFENFENFFNDIKEFRSGRKLYLSDYMVD